MKSIRTAVLVLCAFLSVYVLKAAAERPPLVIGTVLHHGPLEKSFVDIETSVPGFAGWYKERQGDAVVLLKDASRAPEAIARVGRILEARGDAGRKIVARPANYSFSELASVRHLLLENLPRGVYVVDVDEMRNVVAFGVRDDEVAGALRRVAARLGVPPGAIRIERATAPTLVNTLSDYARPVRGGLGVSYSGPYGYGNCTVGVNAIWNNDPNWMGFMTAAHCGKPWQTDGSVFYQGGVRVGYEADDFPPVSMPTWTGCGADELCRYTDAAFVAYDASTRATSNGENTIALPVTWAPSTGVAGTTQYDFDYSEIVGEALPYPAMYDEVNKIGATTGWTYGYINGTCLHLLQSDHPYEYAPGAFKDVRLLCQERSSTLVRFGDSGGPVVTMTQSNDPNWVWLSRFAGLIWGAPNSLESYHSSSWNFGMDFPGYTFWY